MLQCPANESQIHIDHYDLTYQRFNFWINVIACNCLVTFGVISNIIILIVFTVNRHLSSKPLVRYFIGLIVFDLFVLTGTWLLISWKILRFSPIVGNFVPVIYAAFAIANIAMMSCIWCTVLITMERYLSLCHPLLHQRLKRASHETRILICVAVFAIVYLMPKWFELAVSECKDQSSEQILPMLQTTWFSQHISYMAIYRLIGGLIFQSLGPFMLLFFMSFRMSCTLAEAVHFRHQFSTNDYAVVNTAALDIGLTISNNDT